MIFVASVSSQKRARCSWVLLGAQALGCVLCGDLLSVSLLSRGLLEAQEEPSSVEERVIFAVGHATGAPGETVLVPFTVEVKPGGPVVDTCAALVSFDPAALEFAWLQKPSQYFAHNIWDPETLGEEGLIRIWLRLACGTEVHPSSSLEPIYLRFCISPGASPGTYPIDVPSFSGGFETYFAGVGGGSPRREAGSIVVTDAPATPGGAAAICQRPEDYGYEANGPTSDEVTFQLGEVTAAPGQTEVVVPLSILIEEGGPAIWWWSAVVGYDPRAMDGVSMVAVRPAYLAGPLELAPTVQGVCGLLGRHTASGEDPPPISPGDDGTVAMVKFCVPASAPPGVYPLDLRPYAYKGEGRPTNGHSTWFRVFQNHCDVVEGMWPGYSCRFTYCDFVPRRIKGALTIAGDPILGDECPPRPVVFTLGNATAAPGESEVSVPISIHVSPEVSPVVGWRAILRYDHWTLGEVTAESTREAASRKFLDRSKYSYPGTVSLEVTYPEGRPLSWNDDGVVANVRFCVLREASSGPHPLGILRSGWNLEDGAVETVCTIVDGSRVGPVLEDGTVTVEGDPRDGGCQPDFPEPSRTLVATYELPDARSFPGGTVTLPLNIRANAAIQGFSVSVDFDEEVLQVVGIDQNYRRITEPGPIHPEVILPGKDLFIYDNSNETPGNGGVDEGYVAGGVFFSFAFPDSSLPADEDNEVLRIRFAVSPDVPAGTVTEVRFLDGARYKLPGETPGRPCYNLVALEGQSVPPGPNASYVYLNGRIGITADVSVFVRGDSNGDEAIDISDALFTLSGLFLGGPPSPCRDAEDVNDNGHVDVSDPIYLLGYLFLGSASGLPIPFPAAGDDPTPDTLRCWSLDS